MRKDISSELIKKYLAGNCSETEKRIVDDWFAGFEQAEDFISDLPDKEQEQLKSNLLAQIKSNIQEAGINQVAIPEAKVLKLPVTEKPNKIAFYASKIAAILVLACGLAFMGYKYWAEQKSGSTVTAATVFSNNQKQIKKIMLPDGSKIWLQENSSLAVADNFGQIKRAVTLTGEAFFEVAKDTNRPFVIKTNGVITRVLGTSFNIKAYEKDPNVEVQVVTGKVSVFKTESLNTKSNAVDNSENATKAVVLVPNQKATFVKSTHNLVKNKVAAHELKTVFSKASLSFENTAIGQAIQMLNARFNANIKLSNEDLNNCSIYGDFTNQNLPEILEIICNSIEAEYTLYKDEIIITGAGCPLNKPLP
ncbi:anti-sigma factor [Adhaeribacter aerolatus]|uniref:Anti-sigma factor n=1 Tax=Adhaeribacter aerolatus TaxID=670289 RepID=A0A512B2E5_9BACT|nr:FecR family protein [Adhaeribacter aerolatus]GEO06119.1 anti-sigma factor [Adhaeribacter aerolatus]